MLENHLKKTGIGLALLSALMSDCGFVATQRHYINYEPIKKPVHVQIQLYTPKKVKFYFDHPKQADMNKDGIVEPKEIKDYADTMFTRFKSTYSKSK